MSERELLALPPAIDLETANRALALSRSTGYDLARRGDYPCRVLRLGRSYRVITTDLRRLLGVELRQANSSGPAQD
ncbi:integrase [Streptomyces sp. NBC_01803]|uniref:integrase n=1 Tax=Streptomyces sp. NBC_01803 TaxID=2975946 RepID=UPI002DD98C60|nr:integrase [Streptomyces sp. NBC_01803]WSA42961.1 integrase [Streptomyces sp. NBC_01803]